MPVVAPFLSTPEGKAALARAVDEARRRGTTLHLVAFVASPEKAGVAEAYASERASLDASMSHEAARIEASGLACEGHSPVGFHRLAAAVMDVAKTVSAEMIVIGIRRRSRVGKLVMGSDAQDILLNADCEVLTVKVPASDHHE
jgi:nucleotide-binding universal stress UspA family protein